MVGKPHRIFHDTESDNNVFSFVGKLKVVKDVTDVMSALASKWLPIANVDDPDSREVLQRGI